MAREEPESLFRSRQTDKMAAVPSPLMRRRVRALLCLLFGGAFLGTQGALIATAGLRPDHAYGFWMFHESSTVELRFFRVIVAKDDPGGFRRVEAVGETATWEARDSAGALQTRSWRDRVKQPELATFGRRIPAAYGAGAVTARLTAALFDLSEHIEDADSCRFEVDAAVTRNGRDDGVQHLRGPWRCAGKAPP